MSFDPPPPDLAAALEAARDRLGAFAELRYCAEVDSTNDITLALGASGAPEGTSVLAEVQRLGRGRRGRSWFSPAGAGMYLSVLLRPAGPSDVLSLATLASGAGVARAVVCGTGLPVELKWPNDVVIGRPWRKLGGLLCESVGVGSTVEALVVGIGLNLRAAAYPQEIAQQATSIEAELGRPIDRSPLVIEVLASLRETARRLWGGERDWICREWRRFGRAGLGSAPVHWNDQRGEHHGRACDIDETGALVVECDGRIDRLVAGEVTWEKPARD